jgi:hypothetical protein
MRHFAPAGAHLYRDTSPELHRIDEPGRYLNAWA